MKMRIATAAIMAVGLAACGTTGGYGNSSYYGNNSVRSANCLDCGVVQRIESYTGERRQTTGAGALAGAVVGGAIGNQIGSGDGKKAATVAGAIAGGFAGNAIERNRDTTWYDVTVRMNDGRTLVVSQNDLNGLREGSPVVIRNGEAHLD